MSVQGQSAICTELGELLPAYLNGSLEAATARRFEIHLTTCAACRKEERDTRTVWALCEGHLPVELLLDYALASSMPPERQAVIESHLAVCKRCSEELATVRQETKSRPRESSHSESPAQADLGFELPADLNALLEEPRYRDETFLRLYLDHCDEVLFRDPQKGLKLAEIAPRLAEKLRESSRRSSQFSRRELRVRSYAVHGGALRACGRLEEADEVYQIALRVCGNGDVSVQEEANLHQRLAVLRTTQRRFDEAFKVCQGAIETHRAFGHDGYLGEALVILGVAYIGASHFEEAVPCLGEALQLTRNKTSRTYHAAIHNLALALTGTEDRTALKSALRYIREAKRRLRDHRRSLPKHKLTWIEGELHVKISLDRHAERLFWRARQGFLELGAPYELALVGLDLSQLLKREERWSELEDLAAETFGRFRLLSADTESIAALSLWMDAVRAKKLDDEVVADVREKLETRMWRHLPRGRRR